MPAPHGTLHRAVADVVIGTVQAARRFDARREEMGLTELMQQFQVEFTGIANPIWGFVFPSATVPFDVPFYYAPGQRDPEFEHPQFWFGVEHDAANVAVSVNVGGWEIDPDNGAVIGCGLVIGAVSNEEAVPFHGVVHATFQGFGALAEGESDADVGE